jgi:hypothetical protein
MGDINLENFTASSAWLWRFKSHSRIVSKKITRFVRSHYSREKFDIIESSDLFVDSSKICRITRMKIYILGYSKKKDPGKI